MITTRYLVHKILQQIAYNGQVIAFTHIAEDKYHRDVDVSVEYSLKGLYHESRAYQSRTVGNSGTTTTQAQPMLLCLYADGHNKVSKGDTATLNGHTCTVNNTTDVQGLNQILDISFSVLDDEV